MNSKEAETRPEPFFEDRTHSVRLYRGDAMKLLEQAKAEMFDLIFADPPYFLSNNGITCHAGKMVSVNKGDWDKGLSSDDMFLFNYSWLKECQRVLKPNGTIWVSGTSHNIYSVGFAMQKLGFKILNDIAWFKVNPPPNLSCRYFTHATETILWAKRDEKARHHFNYELMKTENHGKQMQSLWSIKAPRPVEKRYGKHPTQKPEALLKRIILSATDEGCNVLDPFSGSGTTGVVSVRFNRKFTGFEISEDYIKLAEKRISDEIKGQNTSLKFQRAA